MIKNNDSKFVNDVINKYNKSYFHYIKHLSNYRFELKEDHIINNDVKNINYIYNNKKNSTNFIFIGYVLSNKLFWINNFNKKLLILIKNYHSFLLNNYEFSENFIQTFFINDIQFIDHIIYLRFMFYTYQNFDSQRIKNFRAVNLK